MKVIATRESFERNINIKGIGILIPGQVYDLPNERVNELMGNNVYRLNFVKHIETKQPKAEVKEEIKEEKPAKKAKKKG